MGEKTCDVIAIRHNEREHTYFNFEEKITSFITYWQLRIGNYVLVYLRALCLLVNTFNTFLTV